MSGGLFKFFPQNWTSGTSIVAHGNVVLWDDTTSTVASLTFMNGEGYSSNSYVQIGETWDFTHTYYLWAISDVVLSGSAFTQLNQEIIGMPESCYLYVRGFTDIIASQLFGDPDYAFAILSGVGSLEPPTGYGNFTHTWYGGTDLYIVSGDFALDNPIIPTGAGQIPRSYFDVSEHPAYTVDMTKIITSYFGASPGIGEAIGTTPYPYIMQLKRGSNQYEPVAGSTLIGGIYGQNQTQPSLFLPVGWRTSDGLIQRETVWMQTYVPYDPGFEPFSINVYSTGLISTAVSNRPVVRVNVMLVGTHVRVLTTDDANKEMLLDGVITVPSGKEFAGLAYSASDPAVFEIGDTAVNWQTTTDLYVIFKDAVGIGDMTLSLFQNTAEENRLNKSSYLTPVGVLSGAIRGECDVINPVFEIQSDGIVNFNYLYISKWNRYYFVTNITSVRTNLWRISLKIDALMSYETGIKNLVALIDRMENPPSAAPIVTDEEMPLQLNKDVRLISPDEGSVNLSFLKNPTDGSPCVYVFNAFP